MFQQTKDYLGELGAIELQHTSLQLRLSHAHRVLQEGQLVDVHRVRDIHEVRVECFEDLGQEGRLEVIEEGPISDVGDFSIDGGDAFDESVV